jgi:hypothetical protein
LGSIDALPCPAGCDDRVARAEDYKLAIRHRSTAELIAIAEFLRDMDEVGVEHLARLQSD